MRRSRLTFVLPCSLLIAVGIGVVAGVPQSASAQAPQPKAPAGEPLRNTSAWNLPKTQGKAAPVAIQGYDPVSYFPEGGGKAEKGSEAFEAGYRNASYRFTSQQHVDMFLADPTKYEPAHGGWCSWAMREGDKVEVDPKSFIVKDGRLFLFYNGFWGDTRAKWMQGTHTEEVAAADAQWKKLSGESPHAGKPTAAAGGATLKETLDARRAEFDRSTPAEVLSIHEQGIRDVAASGVLDTALKVGAKAPDFTLPDATGKPVSLYALLEKGPVVLTWYRGGWCPYCNLQLSAYQSALADIQGSGAQLVAISPQTPDKSQSTAKKNALEFVVLSDAGNKVAHQFGIAYKLPDAVAASFKGKLDLVAFNGDASNELPLAATYVISRTGTITYAFIEADYRRRAEPADIVAAVKQLANGK